MTTPDARAWTTHLVADTDIDIDIDGEEIQERPVRRAARYIRRLTAAGRIEPVADALTVACAGGMSIGFARVVAADPSAYDQAVRDVTVMYLHLLGVTPTGTLTERARASRRRPAP